MSTDIKPPLDGEASNEAECLGLDPILSISQTCRIMGWSRTTHWREVRAGRFSTPVPISPRRKGHFTSTVRKKQEEIKRQHKSEMEAN